MTNTELVNTLLIMSVNYSNNESLSMLLILAAERIESLQQELNIN